MPLAFSTWGMQNGAPLEEGRFVQGGRRGRATEPQSERLHCSDCHPYGMSARCATANAFTPLSTYPDKLEIQHNSQMELFWLNK